MSSKLKDSSHIVRDLEFNTIGSKANDAGIARIIVEAKTELEKIREQGQNVE